MNSTFTIQETVSTAWKVVKANIFVLAGLMIGYFIISFTLGILSGTSTTLSVITNLIMLVVGALFSLGYMRNLFQALDGEEPQFSAYGQESRKILKYILATIIYNVILLIGLVLFIIPGIYLGIRLQFYITFIVDEDCGAIESLKRSWEMTKDQALPLFILLLVMLLIIILGLLFLGVGLFIAAPLCTTMYIIVYRALNTQKRPLEEAIEVEA